MDWKTSGSLLWVHGKRTSSCPSMACPLLTVSQLGQERVSSGMLLPSLSRSRESGLFYRVSHSSAIIQDLERISNAGLASTAYFYFDFKDTGKQDVRALLTSLIIQLCDQSDSFCDVLLRLYRAHRDGSQQPSDAALAQSLKKMIMAARPVPIYLIIDALDECPDTSGLQSSRENVLELVEDLLELDNPNLRLCITSRPEIDIRTSLEQWTSESSRVSLHDQAGQKEDIINYIRSVVHSDKKMKRWRAEDKELVIETLSDRADGM